MKKIGIILYVLFIVASAGIIYKEYEPVEIPTVQNIKDSPNYNPNDATDLLDNSSEKEFCSNDTFIPDIEPIEIIINTTSIERDLKVKFVNKKTNKIITGIEFIVSITNPDGKTQDYTDQDRDGIIYLKDISAGKYKITLLEIDGYKTEKNITEATVKDKIEYKKVEIVDEIKEENEIDVKQEDAAYHESEDTSKTEIKKENTIESVESNKIVISEEKIQKKDSFGQLMYSKQKIDKYGNPIYAVILDEPTIDHIDNNKDGICDRCKKEIHVHTYEKQIEIDATCTQEGKYVLVCSCGDISGEGIIPKKNHIDENKDMICDICGTEITENIENDEKKIETEEKEINKTVNEVSIIIYDTKSAPIYDETSEPVYEEIKEEYKYTGWQTIDGKTYYYDKDGNKVTGTQVIDGIQYTFNSEGVRQGTIGIDVSKFQPSIDWQKVKNAGIDFVIIRCGYRGYGSGVLVEDPMFKSHITGAKAAGLRIGIYFFSQAITEAEAIEEASMAIQLANKYGINMPIAIDSEYANNGSGRADSLSKADRTKITKAFCNTVKNSGYKAMVYASKSWFDSHLDITQLSSYYIWVAHYADKCGYTGRYEIWQNSSKGKIDGINGYVDMNISSI